ncbi:hypothetical protein P9112_000117 [Eukaryota sp. TZLM1-RC]
MDIIRGQLVSLLVTTTSSVNQALNQYHGLTIPAIQSFFGYLSLALLSFPAYRKQVRNSNRSLKWRIYFLYTIFDVLATYIVVLAYRFGTISSIMLLDCFSLFICLFMGYFLLNLKALKTHYLGIFIAMFGMVILISSDTTSQSGSHPLLGDLLALSSATILGLCNVFQEMFLVNASPQEFCFSIGVSGFLISGLITCLFELPFVSSLGSLPVVSLLLLFSISFGSTYLLVPLIISSRGATFFNIALLSSDCFAVFSDFIIFGKDFRMVSIFSLVCIIIGLYIYLLRPLQKRENKETIPLLR